MPSQSNRKAAVKVYGISSSSVEYTTRHFACWLVSSAYFISGAVIVVLTVVFSTRLPSKISDTCCQQDMDHSESLKLS
jgi:hypothetical protein